MEHFTTLGDLLLAFRKTKEWTQLDLAEALEVDVRTVTRWEKNESLVKANKEEELVDTTFIPYQVIRNLNAPVAIPTYYDFALRKYAVQDIGNPTPNAGMLEAMKSLTTDRIRTIQSKAEINMVLKSANLQAHIQTILPQEVILKAIELLPDINLIMFDVSGYYAGHTLYLPLAEQTYQKIKDKSMNEWEIKVEDLIAIEGTNNPIYYLYDISADSNETLFYISAQLKKYFQKPEVRPYTTATITSRYDNYEIQEQIGSELVWEDTEWQKEIDAKAPPRLYEKFFE